MVQYVPGLDVDLRIQVSAVSEMNAELYDAAWLAWHEWARAWRLALSVGGPVG